MDPVYIVGVGMTPFGLFPDRSIKAMAAEAVRLCLADAGADRSAVQSIVFANVGQAIIEGQSGTPGQIALRPIGFEQVPIMNVENACASGTTALHVAWTQVKAGLCDVALAVGVEKLSTDDTERRDAMFAGGLDVHNREDVLKGLAALAGETYEPSTASDRSIFMEVYGYWARAHMNDFGTTQRQLAAIAAKNHGHSVHNPLCQFRRPFTVEEVLAGRPLAFPLTVPMCSAYSDGGAAALVCSREGVQRLKAEAAAVPILSLALTTGVNREPHDWDRHITAIAASQAYERAGLGPDEIDLAEVHDATAFGELLNVENLGLAKRGHAGLAAERGETSLGGRIPVNVSGGLESRGHPVGATGLAQVHELVTQLRGRAGQRQVEGARHGILENGGGIYGIEEAAAVVGIFAAPGGRRN